MILGLVGCIQCHVIEIGEFLFQDKLILIQLSIISEILGKVWVIKIHQQ